MPNQPTAQISLNRDGTSQASRIQPALDPNYIAVDERSVKDLLAFARKYAKELQYYAVEKDQVKPQGDWSSFLPDTLDLDEVAAFLHDPENFTSDRTQFYTRPHFVLFLTFLQLLRQTQDLLNRFTGRHLDFYYQQVLHMTKRPAQADKVNVLVDLVPSTAQFLLPNGILLAAGADATGQPRFYRTEQELFVNHAQKARLSSIFVDKQVTGIREVREQHKANNQEAVLAMLSIALGDPSPGGPLPKYGTEEQDVIYALLFELYKLVQFVDSGLRMNFPAFRSLMQLKQRRAASGKEWDAINQLLEKAGKQRTKNPNFTLKPAKPRDFNGNLKTVLGDAPSFDGIPEVENINDLYNHRIREEVKRFIQEKLYFDNVDDFVSMMQIKMAIDNEWQEINRILEQAGQRKNPSYLLSAGADPTTFEANLKAAIGSPQYPNTSGEKAISSLDDFYNRIQAIETYFWMSAENFAYLMTIAEKQGATAQEWMRVYTLLDAAYRKKFYASRRAADLQTRRETHDLAAMLDFAVGDAPVQTGQSALELLRQATINPDDAAFLEQIAQRDKDKNSEIKPDEWNKFYTIVEGAERVREKQGEPVAQKVEWRNLYPAQDATSVRVTTGVAGDEKTPRWQTFGQAPLAAKQDDPPPPATLGWAISSPLLMLSQGQRTITLTLCFQSKQSDTEQPQAPFQPDPADSADEVTNAFRIELSTAKGWIEPDKVEVKKGHYQLSGTTDKTVPATQWTLTFKANSAPLAPLPAADAQIQTPWPVLRLMLRPNWQASTSDSTKGSYIIHYPTFQALVLLRADLQVAVEGLTPLQIQNDETPLAANKPFEPFGSHPVVGSRFYLGHPELVYKKLGSLKFHIDWMGVPTDLNDYYSSYSLSSNTTSDTKVTMLFNVGVSLIDQQLELPLQTNASLFTMSTVKDSKNKEETFFDASKSQIISIDDIPLKAITGNIYDRATMLTMDEDLLAWNRYLRWELNSPDFQHDAYPRLVAEKSIELAAAIANQTNNITAADYKVNPPYTPKIKKLSLDYTASIEISPGSAQSGEPLDRLFHIHPFGYSALPIGKGIERPHFLPAYPNEGELYIGLQDATPPQNLTLLWQVAEGSANPDLTPTPVQWSYLSDNRWLSLDGSNVLQDTTRGLINSGIILFDLPPAQPNTLLPDDLYWLRAAIAQNSNSVCDTVEIHTQAVSATLVESTNSSALVSQPLPPRTITELATPLPAIAHIRQPYTSFGGKPAEQDSTFYTRVSERLRHKQRALTLWDYERLILDRFPQIYKAKCLPADLEQPGQVTVIVIPDIQNKSPFNPFEPKAPADLLADIRAYLVDKLPAFAAITVKNAAYIPVQVRFAVRFLPGYNAGYYKQHLNDDLNRFLSPWAYEEGADIVIGSRVYANIIINFLEERLYVDYVAKIQFIQADGLEIEKTKDGYWVEPTQPAGVLVAARQHVIDLITEVDFHEENFTGINYMMIEVDFKVE